jgi:hypothetical protein
MSYTIYAIRAEQEDSSLIDALCQELRKGRARFGWSYQDSLDPRDLKARIALCGWNSLRDEEQKSIARTAFLLDVRPGDCFVYINMPSFGRCTAVKIVEREGVGPDKLSTTRQNGVIRRKMTSGACFHASFCLTSTAMPMLFTPIFLGG